MIACQNKRNTELTQNYADNFGTASSGNLHRKTIKSRFSIQFSAAKVLLFYIHNKTLRKLLFFATFRRVSIFDYTNNWSIVTEFCISNKLLVFTPKVLINVRYTAFIMLFSRTNTSRLRTNSAFKLARSCISSL